MLARFLRDALDICLMRVKSLEEYSYAAWMPAAWLCLIGIADAASSTDLDASLGARLLFFVSLNWLETVLLAVWLMLWYRITERKALEGSLFPLMVLCATPDLIAPALAQVPGDIGNLLKFALMVYGMTVSVRALMIATRQKLAGAMIAVLSFLPVALLLVSGATSVAAQMGWIHDEPPTSAPTAEEIGL
ncbi:hypothetical protein [Silvimonas iriomotensis]|uniref:Yip1 domain-containing protein n=1 Tax=Silvimonas iriomotensis TaxID=449662 RepID=A0ABQ2P6T7_9NEIS|nr:hypothetical protein [Silvimonas iriomotensis]GGP19472.1 hypothetical protein GCM10010970_10780 [Silvimonas iriomotensis]